jgi:hypothetical protein
MGVYFVLDPDFFIKKNQQVQNIRQQERHDPRFK